MFGENFTTEPSAGAWSVLERYPWCDNLRQALDTFHGSSAPLLNKTVAELLEQKEA